MLKTLCLLPIIALLSSCQTVLTNNPVVVTTITTMSDNLCCYTVGYLGGHGIHDDNKTSYWFADSCSKFQIADTVKLVATKCNKAPKP